MPWTEITPPTGSWTVGSAPSGSWSGTTIFPNTWSSSGGCSVVGGAAQCTPSAVVITPPTVPNDTALATDLLFLEGFEVPDSYVTAAGANAMFTMFFAGTGTAAISATTRGASVTAGKSIALNAPSASTANLQWNYKNTSSTRAYMRGYFKIETLTNGNGSARDVNILGFTDSTGHRGTLMLRLPANPLDPVKFGARVGIVTIATTTGTVSVSTGTWYRVELVMERITTGTTVNVNLYSGDSTSLLETITATTTEATSPSFAFIQADTAASNVLNLLFDDIRVQTATPAIPAAATNLPLYGPGGVWMSYPSGAGLSQWTPASGTNFSNVDEFPLAAFDDDTSYVRTAADTGAVQYDSYTVTYTSSVPGGKTITAVQVRIRQRTEGGASSNPVTACTFTNADGTVYPGSTVNAVSGTYINFPITPLQVSNLFMIFATPIASDYSSQFKIGFQRAAGASTRPVRMTSCWGYVDVKP